jgi:radical SAM protein with 4Fe4S-binding SPASM domain
MATDVVASIPEIPLSQFQQRIGLGRRRLPVQGTLETTFRCNLRCVHCYVNEPAGDAGVAAQELPTERLKELIDEFAAAGTLQLLMTGGEVLVRSDFAEVYLHALRRGLLVTIFTNGTLVTDAIADLLDEYRPEGVEISLYGMTRETYEKVTGIPGSYDKCLAGIARLVARGIPLKLKTMALTWNRHEVEAMHAYARGLGLDFKFDGLLNPRVDCGANRNGELQLTAAQVLALDLAEPGRLAEFRDFCAQFVPRGDAPVAHERVYTCGAGETSFTVDPYGRLQLCQLSRRAYFDLKQGSFAEGWNEYFPKLRARTWQTGAVCRTCNLMALCGSCPGAAEMEHGDPEAVVAQFCEIAHLRAHAVMGESSGHRSDALCCLGRGTLGGRPAEVVERLINSSCGSGCGSHETPAPKLIQIERRR